MSRRRAHPPGDRRGLALVELLVTMAVLTLLFLMVDTLFINTHRSARKAELTADVTQNARIAAERLIRELRESGATGVQIGGSGTEVIFRSARPADAASTFCVDWTSAAEPLAAANPGCAGIPFTGTYAPVWQRWIGYYFDAMSGEIRRVASTTALAFPLAGGQVVAALVESFTITASSGAHVVRVKGGGQGTVQGSAVPVQEVVLEGRVQARN